jgi:hypothetical protein
MDDDGKKPPGPAVTLRDAREDLVDLLRDAHDRRACDLLGALRTRTWMRRRPEPTSVSRIRRS